MRKRAITLLFILLAFTGLASLPSHAIDHSKRVSMLMKEYSSNTDFQVINLGRLGLSVVKTAMRKSGDKDALEILDLMKNVKHVSIATYADCDSKVKSQFSSRLSRVLTRDLLLVEAKDGGDKVQIFAIPEDDGKFISDLIISAPSSGALICVKGSINVTDVVNFLESKSK